MKTIKYIGYYALPKEHKDRYFVLAATNKMTYICRAINDCGHAVEIVSASGSRTPAKAESCGVLENTHVKLFRSLGAKGKIQRVLSRWLLLAQFFCYLLLHTKKNEPVLAYHSLGYARLLRLLKRIKGFRLILEVEEIYSDVTGNEKSRAGELALFRAADAYIFPTELLDEMLNTEKKPSVIIHGTYQVEEKREDCKFLRDELHEKKHLLYAGTFDPRKGGAIAAAAAAAHLTSDYHIHILGFGTEDEKKYLQEEVEKAAKCGGATVTMDGLLSGEEYIRFVQSCDVGFSTQIPDAAFNNTSFPSKVLSYMANGLRVVSVKIPALQRSAIGDMLYYYEGNDPKTIAEAVMRIDWNEPYDSRAVLRELDAKFVEEIGALISG